MAGPLGVGEMVDAVESALDTSTCAVLLTCPVLAVMTASPAETPDTTPFWETIVISGALLLQSKARELAVLPEPVTALTEMSVVSPALRFTVSGLTSSDSRLTSSIRSSSASSRFSPMSSRYRSWSPGLKVLQEAIS